MSEQLNLPNDQNKKLTQDEVNRMLLDACGKFRGLIDPAAYKDYILIILFIKYISDVWKDKYIQLKQEHGDEPELIKTLIQEERFVIPEGASFDDLYKTRHQPELGERIDVAKDAIEEANPKLERVFLVSFNSDQLGDEQQKNELLKVFPMPLVMHPLI